MTVITLQAEIIHIAANEKAKKEGKIKKKKKKHTQKAPRWEWKSAACVYSDLILQDC